MARLLKRQLKVGLCKRGNSQDEEDGGVATVGVVNIDCVATSEIRTAFCMKDVSVCIDLAGTKRT
jgi:hypothetical protein